MKRKNYLVKATGFREDVNGDFIARINPDEIFLSPLTRFIIVKNTLEGEVFKIPVLLQTSEKVTQGEIQLDQKIMRRGTADYCIYTYSGAGADLQWLKIFTYLDL